MGILGLEKVRAGLGTEEVAQHPGHGWLWLLLPIEASGSSSSA